MLQLARILVTAAVTSTLALAIVAVPDVAAASCGGSKSGCDHTSPETTGCAADAVTKLTVRDTDAGNRVMKVELRYSPTCRTAWSRVSTTADSTMWVTETVRRLSDGVSDTDSDPIIAGVNGYSHQLYVRGDSARACGTDTLGASACTAYFTFPS
jgi:hypothetical protein